MINVKGQSAIEFMFLISVVGIIVIIAISVLYSSYHQAQKTFPTATEYISSFSIGSFSTSTNSLGSSVCSFNFSFSSQANVTAFPIYLKLNSPTGKFYFLNINSTYFTELNYYQTAGTYYYSYSSISDQFNSTVCGLFNQYNNGKVGDISEVIANYSGKSYAFKLYSPTQTIYP